LGHFFIVMLLLALLSVSCAGPPPPDFKYAHGADADGYPRPQRFLVLPFNMTIPVSNDLKARQGDVFGELVGYLRGRGNEIKVMDSFRARKLWSASIADVEASGAATHGYDAAIALFASRASQVASFDALIMPSLVYRDTKIKVDQRIVKWDGVIRRYDIVNYSDKGKRLGLSSVISPVIPGVSLYLVILTPDGEKVFEKYGGISITHDVDLTKSEVTMTSELKLMERRLFESDHVRQGIEIVFDPYLPRD
jgi:hypothetical protein